MNGPEPGRVTTPPPQETPRSRVRVLYLAGWQRNGSTIVSNILGEQPSYFHAGELYYLWDYVWHDNTLCGCGHRFHECPLWARIVHTGFPSGIDAAWMRDQAVRASKTSRMLDLGLGAIRDRRVERLRVFRRMLSQLYRAVARETGASVIVDSSKWPSYGLLLGTCDAVDVSVLHLVRDPRAVAHSWLRKKKLEDRPDQTLEMYRSPMSSTSRWLTWNLASELYWRGPGSNYVRLRYEDVMTAPEEQLTHALRQLRLPVEVLPFLTSHQVRLGANHTISGNPDRLRHGTTTIRADDEWRHRLSRRDRITAHAAALPLMYRYGYR